MNALLGHVENRPQDTAFVFENEAWTYDRLASEANRLARGMALRGLRKGDRVALHMTNRPEMLVAYYACFQLGLIAAPLRTAFTPAELIPLLERLQPALYIGEVSLYDNVAPMDHSRLSFEKRFVVGGIVDDFRVENWQKLFDTDSNARISVPVDIDAPAVLINTSGTTGVPKFVTHTHATLAATGELAIEHFGFERNGGLVEYLALAHASGLMTFLACMQAGMKFYLVRTFDPDVVLDMIEQNRCTVLFGFPASYASMLERQLVRPRDLKSLRMCLVGGDICPDALQAQVSAAFGVTLSNFWGASEAVGSLTYGQQPGPVSRIVDGKEFRLIDEHGADVRPGETGELCLRGPHLFVGYWNGPGATSEGLEDGWYHTGDLMRRGNGNDIWFVARKKDIIIRGGTNISPVEIENALLAAHPAVVEAAVVGVPDPALGQRVVGFVRLAGDTADSVLADILASVAGRLAPYKVPERLTVLTEMPRNALSKVDRNALAKLAAQAAPVAAESPDAHRPAATGDVRPPKRAARR
jgi:acyl-CoA synthetase (AMP-forming)/AMP-acid ligase II